MSSRALLVERALPLAILVVAIVAVPTLIAGIYGMNFDNMPELHWELGYPLALGVMGVICVTLYRAFKRSGWL